MVHDAPRRVAEMFFQVKEGTGVDLRRGQGVPSARRKVTPDASAEPSQRLVTRTSAGVVSSGRDKGLWGLTFHAPAALVPSTPAERTHDDMLLGCRQVRQIKNYFVFPSAT